jgi:methylenetetrahydrofolate dehydrogenase (NADP+)/methenyltetrahydrofolate cyclohydrolase
MNNPIIIDGKSTAASIREEVRLDAGRLKERGITPCLAVILAGENPASLSYVNSKQKALVQAGMEGRDIRLPETVGEEELLSLIAALNADKKVHGILVQLPLPAHINQLSVMNALDPRKDVDGFNPYSMGMLFLGQPTFVPCTPKGVVVLLEKYDIPVSGKHVVVVGRSNIVGKPLSAMLSQRDLNATVTLCHTGTADLPFHTRQADILIAAAGKPGLIRGNMVKPGAAVIDVGINRVADASEKGYCISGDVNFDEVAPIAGWITPVPGGVGPMTIAMLMRNVLEAAKGQKTRRIYHGGTRREIYGI